MGLFRGEQKVSASEKNKGVAFEFSTGTKNYHPMQKSQEMMKSFRNDISETERARKDSTASEPHLQTSEKPQVKSLDHAGIPNQLQFPTIGFQPLELHGREH